MAVTIAPPENLQRQSALLRLPAEIKNTIYSLCLIAEAPIVDPGCIREGRNTKPRSLRGISLLQTCRRNYHEADRRPLFAQNTFRFSNLDTMHSFLHSLSEHDRMHVQDIEIDVRNLNLLRYLAWEKAARSLCVDAVGLRCLRLNFEAWPIIPIPRELLWKFLRSMLSRTEGFLDRVVVTGASRTNQSPFSPVHFVGGDEVGTNDLLFRMSRSVVGRPEDKVVRWKRGGGKLQLEVMSTTCLPKHMETRWLDLSKRQQQHTWPLNGSCIYFDYESSLSGINPSVAE